MKIFFTVAFLLNAVGVIACSCVIMPPIKIKDDVKAYNFIALVKFEKIVTHAPDSIGRINADAKMTIKELFKGAALASINILDYGFTCEGPNPKEDEQWLVFGFIWHGNIITTSCVCYRVDGVTEIMSFNGPGRLNALRHVYEHDTIK